MKCTVGSLFILTCILGLTACEYREVISYDPMESSISLRLHFEHADGTPLENPQYALAAGQPGKLHGGDTLWRTHREGTQRQVLPGVIQVEGHFIREGMPFEWYGPTYMDGSFRLPVEDAHDWTVYVRTADCAFFMAYIESVADLVGLDEMGRYNLETPVTLRLEPAAQPAS